MNMDAVFRLILLRDTMFICVKAPFLDKKCLKNNFLRHLKYQYGIYALKLHGKRLSTHEIFNQ